MSGSLDHSPADIVRRLLISLGLGTAPSDGDSWPIAVAQEPDTPDNCITVYGTTGRGYGRHQTDGEVQGDYGIQLRVRSQTHSVGWARANALAECLDKTINLDAITIGESTYTVYSIGRSSPDVLELGKERGTQRYLFTINAVCGIRQTA